MTLSNEPKLVTVFGGSGFIGRHVVRALAKRGYNVRAAVRRPDLAGHLQPMGNVGQIVAVQANLRNPESVQRAIQGADHVVNLVGILFERGRNTFDNIQHNGARAVAEACRAAGIGLTHVSAIGADSGSLSDYGRTKGLAEEAVRQAVPDATIIRPSIVFGPEDDFFNKFAEMARFSPFLPLIGGGVTHFQPVYVGDVAEAVAKAVDGVVEPGKTWELGGPEILDFRQCLTLMLEMIGRKRAFLSIPWYAASLLGRVMSLVPLIDPVLTRDQVVLLRSDNVVSAAAESEGRTLAGLGIEATTLEAILPSYLVRFKPAGQFTKDLIA
ncbi:complex I NDUFA9 subunit family protein [Hoeflea poritis]|uniref:Complex I NDUFA9 subunit family protein n=1 Tax=Hoeflea poritis TaxID=2993659 RepID=A0ABT4VMB2_9HYPH|nr:complex I NDUFA9 subunit family protein [Hoeflea poritis]MDA4845295.1 complex I NDUFA9 subunit family protein [Hoeflea poritis]